MTGKTLDLKSVKLRKHPYPFLCSLAICSDLDRCSFNDFLNLHLFLNTKEETPWGAGLGLEIGDSFWMYSAGSRTDDAFSYFRGLNPEKSEYAEFIRAGIEAGYLDCLHTYGHFSQYGGFQRSLAETALEELTRLNLRVKVWCNHGNIHNLQNIGTGLGDLPVQIQASGDSTPVEEYHTDLMLAYGMIYTWIGDVTDVIGQDRYYGLPEYLMNIRCRSGVKSLIRVMLSIVGGKCTSTLARKNDLTSLHLLRDGAYTYKFCRFLPQLQWGRDWGDDLQYTLDPHTLDLLVKEKGNMVSYVHLGKKRNGLLSARTIECLQNLQRRVECGEIWVTTTSRLLNYSRTSRYLSWDCRGEGGAIIITIRGLEDPVRGASLVPTKDCQNLTWYTPAPRHTKIISADGQTLRTQINEMDETGRGSVTIPLEPLDPTKWLSPYYRPTLDRRPNVR